MRPKAHIFNICNMFGVVKINFYPDIFTATAEESSKAYELRINNELAKRTGAVLTPYCYKDLRWFDGSDGYSEAELSP